jgi:hypothetical protein
LQRYDENVNSRTTWIISAVLLWGCTTVPILGTDAGSTEPADCVPSALSEPVPEAAVAAAQQALQEQYTDGDALSLVCGIDFVEGESPSLGEPYRWVVVDPSEMAGSSPDPERFLPVWNRWLFPILWQGEVKCYTMASDNDGTGEWYTGSWGMAGLVNYLGPVEQATALRTSGFVKYYNPDIALVVFNDIHDGPLFYLFDPAGWSDAFEGKETGEVYVTLDEFVHLWIENYGTDEAPDGSI